MGLLIALLIFILLFLVAAAAIFWVIGVYNDLIKLDERVHNSIAQIAAQVESRWDALVSLADLVKQYSSHEVDTLERIVKQRQPVTKDVNPRDLTREDNVFENAKLNIQAVAEQYPDLKADGLYRDLMADINQHEDNVRESRMIYNDTVTRFNRQIRMFPISYIANLNNYKPYDYFTASDEKTRHPLADNRIGG